MSETRDKASNTDALFGSWHPENWDAVTLQWLKRPEGAGMLAMLKAVPDLYRALAESVRVVTDRASGGRMLTSISEARRIEKNARAALARATKEQS